MKRIIVFASLVALCLPSTWAQAASKVTIQSIPDTIEEFVSLRGQLAQTPEGAAAMLVIAMLKYSQDPALGMQCFTAILVNDGSLIRKSSGAGYQGFEPTPNAQYLIKRLDGNGHLARSYFVGTSPENAYDLGSFPLDIATSRNNYSEQSDGSIRLFVKSSGADSPRPVTVRKNSQGIWKVWEFSSLVVGIRKPVENVVDEL